MNYPGSEDDFRIMNKRIRLSLRYLTLTRMANEHISDYLEYYSKLEIEPEFAVLLRGPWGCGKSWFIKNFLKEKDLKHLYISLNGVSRIKEIEDSIFQQIHPVLSSKGMKIAGKLFKGLLKTTIKVDIDGDGNDDASITSNIPDVDVETYFNNVDERIIVFDDLERCSLPIKDIMGYINQYVEVNGLKVVILAKESEILDQPENGKVYKEIKEKLIGKSFDVTTDFESAKIHFIEQLKDQKIKDYLTNTPIIQEIYTAAAYNNLRHLKQSLLDFERFILLAPNHSWDKDGLIDHLLRLFLAISFELKKGKLIESDIIFLFQPPIFKEDSKEVNPLRDIRSKYPVIQLSLPVGSTVLRDYFINGILNKDFFARSIKSSSYYQDENTPYWQKLFYMWNLENEEYEEYRVKALDSLESKSIEDKYELLHVSGILISLANQGFIDLSASDIAQKSIDCFEEMKTNGSFSVAKDENFPSTHSHGLEYKAVKTDEMKELLEYARKITNESIEEDFPAKARELCETLANSVQDFNDLINITNSRGNLYYETPIFKYVDPQMFHDAVLGLKNKDKRRVAPFMEQRYAPGRFNSKLFEEIEKLEQINELFNNSLDSLKDIEKILIDKLIQSIKKCIEEIKKENVRYQHLSHIKTMA